MSQAEIRAGLIADLARLARDGSGSPVLEACTTLLSLRPVSLAVEAGALAAVAARNLLDTVAQRAVTTQTYLRAAAALTGVDPPDTNRGVKGEPRLQRLEQAGNILGVGARVMRGEQKQQRCYQEYAEAVLGFVRAAGQDQTVMESYLLQCGITDDVAALLVGRVAAPALTAGEPRSDKSQQPELASDSEPARSAHFARLIPLSGLVRQAMDAARTSCKARNRAFYTPDLLLALLDMPRSRTADCFEEVQPGLARRVQDWLSHSLSDMNPAQAHPFQPFEWTERADVQVAQDLAALDGSAVVSEVYLLLGVLGSESGTRERLVELLGLGYDRLAEVAGARRRHPLHVLRTPGPGSGFNGTD